MDLRDAAVIAGQKADQHVGEIIAGVAVEPPHDPEIDDDDRPRGIDEHVARMHVGVKKAVAEHLVEKGAGRLAPGQSSIRWPAAISAARSSMRIPSMRSRVKHAAAGARQSMRGTRKSGSPAKFSASSDAAAASNRKSISKLTDFGQGPNDLDRLQAGATADGAARSARASHKNRSRSRAKACRHPRPQHLDRDLARPRSVQAKCTCAIEAAATAVSSNDGNRFSSGCAELGLDRRRAPRRPGKAAAGPAGSRGRRRAPRRADRRGSTASGRA